MLSCKRMRTIVIASAIALIVGIVLEIAVQTITFSVPSVAPAVLSALAAFSVLFALSLLAVTFLTGLLPGAAKRLTECQH